MPHGDIGVQTLTALKDKVRSNSWFNEDHLLDYVVGSNFPLSLTPLELQLFYAWQQ